MAGALHGVLASLKAAAAAVTDAYFKYVSLLLNTTSTNGAQNNTFLDGSTNAFSITRNGNTTQGTFSPFSQTGWSNYFDGTGDYLTAPDNAAFDFGSGDFTVEMWYYPQATPAETTLISKWNAGGVAGSNQWLLYLATATTSAAVSTDGTNSAFVATGPNVVLSQWNHIAFVRNGNNFTVYTNGVGGTAQTNSGSLYALDTEVLGIGYRRNSGTPVIAMQGYASQVRIVKGTAVYTSNFTPPTIPLTNITNTSLLTCQSNRFIDNSSNNFTVTRNGDVSVQAFSPFNPTAAWSASTNGGSGYFDGTGDYLATPASTAFNIGTGAFTLECWVYPQGTEMVLFSQGNNGIDFWAFAGNTLIRKGLTNVLVIGSNIPAKSQWTHVVAVRSGTTMSVFFNGVRVGTITDSTDFSPTTATGFVVGFNGTVGSFLGYIANSRIVVGTAVYDPTLTTLTVPTAPLTAVTNTQLLLNFTNAGIFDSASGNDLETVGNAQVSTVQKKFGTTSMFFDGTGDWLTAIDRPTLQFGTAPFTIEFWIWRNVLATQGFISKRNATPTGWFVGGNASNKLEFRADATVIASTASILGGQWYHIAVVREGTGANQTKLYIDGVNDGTGTIANNFTNTDVLFVGADQSGASPFTGYIDDLRITNGYARYTANFTPPTAAFPLQ